MHRRSLLLGAAAAVAAPLARPAIAGNTQTLSIVPQVALNSIDPVWTSSQIARNMGFMVFDLLYGRDEAMNPRPQMLEGDLMEDDGRRWTLRLRDGLRFHDKEPVLARDVVASIYGAEQLVRWWIRRDCLPTISVVRRSCREAASGHAGLKAPPTLLVYLYKQKLRAIRRVCTVPEPR